MGADVPPDLLGIINALGLDQDVDVVLELGVARERIGDTCAWEVLKYLGAIALVARIQAQPEGLVCR